MKARRGVTIAAWAGFLGLVALHLDWWRPQRARLWLGWIPEELAWRLLWMALATAYLFFFCARVWRADESEGEAG
jgi:hypothetical protein